MTTGTIVLNVQERGARRTEASLRSVENRVLGIQSTLKKGLGLALGSIITIQGLRMLGQAASSSIDFANSLGTLDAQAAKVTQTSEELIDTIQDITSSQLSMAESADIASKAILFLGQEGADSMGDLSLLAGQVATVTGGDIPAAFEKLFVAISTGRDQQLQRIGITVDFAAALQEAADSAGKLVDELTPAEEAAARLSATLAAGAVKFEGIEIDINVINALTSSVKDLGDMFINVLFGGNIESGIQSLTGSLDKMTDALKNPEVAANIKAIATALGIITAGGIVAKGIEVITRNIGILVIAGGVLAANFDKIKTVFLSLGAFGPSISVFNEMGVVVGTLSRTGFKLSIVFGSLFKILGRIVPVVILVVSVFKQLGAIWDTFTFILNSVGNLIVDFAEEAVELIIGKTIDWGKVTNAVGYIFKALESVIIILEFGILGLTKSITFLTGKFVELVAIQRDLRDGLRTGKFEFDNFEEASERTSDALDDLDDRTDEVGRRFTDLWGITEKVTESLDDTADAADNLQRSFDFFTASNFVTEMNAVLISALTAAGAMDAVNRLGQGLTPQEQNVLDLDRFPNLSRRILERSALGGVAADITALGGEDIAISILEGIENALIKPQVEDILRGLAPELFPATGGGGGGGGGVDREQDIELTAAQQRQIDRLNEWNSLQADFKRAGIELAAGQVLAAAGFVDIDDVNRQYNSTIVSVVTSAVILNEEQELQADNFGTLTDLLEFDLLPVVGELAEAYQDGIDHIKDVIAASGFGDITGPVPPFATPPPVDFGFGKGVIPSLFGIPGLTGAQAAAGVTTGDIDPETGLPFAKTKAGQAALIAGRGILQGGERGATSAISGLTTLGLAPILGPFAPLVGELFGGIFGGLFGGRKPDPVMEPVPVTVVNFEDMGTALLNVIKGQLANIASPGIDSINVRLRERMIAIN